ncbi:hypothetical protein ACJA88_010220 [Fusarium oxysporum]
MFLLLIFSLPFISPYGISHLPSAATRHQNPTIIMGLLAKLKFKLRKRLAQGTVEPVAHGILGLVSLERVCKRARCSLTPEYTRRVIKIATMQAAEYASERATATMHLLLHLTDQACLPRALVALESQLVRLCKICTVCLGMNGIHIIAYSVELAHSFELRHQRNQDFDGLRTLDTPQILTLSLSHSLKCLGGLA